jgi:sugar phosphate isomerase/epimerase
MTLRLGLAQGLVPTDPDELTPELAAQIASLGVTAITTHFQVPPAELIGRRGGELRSILEQAGLALAQCGGLRPDLVSPDRAAHRESIAALHDLMLAAQTLGAEMIIAGVGSHNAQHPYGPSRENHSEAARERLVANLRELGRLADDAGMLYALEPHVLTTLDTPERIRDILDEVNSPWIRCNYDPVNFIGSLANAYDSGAVARHVQATIGPRLAPSAHIKDIVVEPELVLHLSETAPGTGIMDLAAVLQSCTQLPDSSAVIIEHLDQDAARGAIRSVAQLADSAGIEFAAR